MYLSDASRAQARRKAEPNMSTTRRRTQPTSRPVETGGVDHSAEHTPSAPRGAGLSTVRSSGWRADSARCKKPSTAGNTIYTPTQILNAFAASGYELVSAFPNVGTQRAVVLCVVCEQPRHLSAAELLRGRRGPCRHRRTDRTRRARRPARPEELRRWQARPLEPQPDDVVTPWRLQCTECGQHLRVTVNRLRSQGRLCAHKETYEERSVRQTEQMIKYGFWPVGPYPGRACYGWPGVCLTCGQMRSPSIDNLKRRGACRHQGAAQAISELDMSRSISVRSLERHGLRLWLVSGQPTGYFTTGVSLHGAGWAPIAVSTSLDDASAAYGDSAARLEAWSLRRAARCE